ncbi:MAG: DUF484 family protein [Reinekea sp.]
MTEMVNSEDISEEDVIRFLRQYPRFFEDNPNLLKKLHLKHDSGEAISLIERQNLILRKENSELIDRLNRFIEVAQRNDKLFINLQKLVIDLISCNTLNDIAKTLHSTLTTNFAVDAVQLILSHRLLTDGDVWLYCDKSTLKEHFPAAIEHARNECGIFTETTRQLLFPEQNIESVAVGVITHKGTPVGIIALGSEDAAHFRLEKTKVIS